MGVRLNARNPLAKEHGEALRAVRWRRRGPTVWRCVDASRGVYSTVTLFARFRGWSTSVPFSMAT